MISIPFSDIYIKSIGLFDDPKITIAYETNKIQFNKLMYTFLQNSISMFDNPISIVERLSTYSIPKGTMETFVSDGSKVVYLLSENFTLLDNSIYQYTADGEEVDGRLDKTNKTITFPDPIDQGKEFSFEQYSVGEFLFSLDDLTSKASVKNAIVNSIKDILARLLIKSWGENTRNFLLDIQNILSDTDFKLHPSSKVLDSKNAWIAQLDKEVGQYKSKLGWNIKLLTSSYKGGE